MKNKNLKIFTVIVLVCIIGGLYIYSRNSSANIKGCYVAHLMQDVYTLNITNQNAASVSGTLAFHNAEKDSSSGNFTGTYNGSILLGDYSFSSEGMISIRQVIFKKSGNNFVEGFGDVTTSGNEEKFSDLNNITYDPNSTFMPSSTCQ